jgi:hypothetical protein
MCNSNFRLGTSQLRGSRMLRYFLWPCRENRLPIIERIPSYTDQRDPSRGGPSRRSDSGENPFNCVPPPVRPRFKPHRARPQALSETQAGCWSWDQHVRSAQPGPESPLRKDLGHD